jgi:hypothetical protein
MYGPIFICCCCHRSLFKASVIQFSEKVMADIKLKAPNILDTCLYDDNIEDDDKTKPKHNKTQKKAKNQALH